MIGCRNLRKSFGSHRVLDGVDLDIRKGETIVVLGHSGTGKSVLLKHLNGLIRPDEGTVTFHGRDITRLSEAELVTVRRNVGMLFQGGALFDSLTVEDNVAFALDEHRICRGEERRRRVAHLLEIVGLGGTQHKLPAELSGGMRKRAALARSLALEPEVMLYDEPTTGLDPVTAQQINELIRDLQARLGLTSVVVTHDLASAAFVADRMAFLYNGVIRCVGTPEQLRSSDDPVIAQFMSAAAVAPAPKP
ncbi:MAG: ABC transporter ATP-binding protein [Candidatus Dadabacteria bacterium]|nr:MAG: ABC transporter ATP-binding protein [Candidatus Dadabacteria bacterium]